MHHTLNLYKDFPYHLIFSHRRGTELMNQREHLRCNWCVISLSLPRKRYLYGKKIHATMSQIKHVPPHSDFWHDAACWRLKRQEAGEMSLWCPCKGNTIEMSEKTDSLPLYMHVGRCQILFCIIGRGRAIAYPLYNKLWRTVSHLGRWQASEPTKCNVGH
jgi:hypothetical protein